MKKLTEEQLFEIASGEVSRDAYGPLSAEDERELGTLVMLFGDLKVLDQGVPEMQFSEDRLRHAIEAAGKPVARRPFAWWWLAAPGVAASALVVVMLSRPSPVVAPEAPVAVVAKNDTPAPAPAPSVEEAVESAPLTVVIPDARQPEVSARPEVRRQRPARRPRERVKPMVIARLDEAARPSAMSAPMETKVRAADPAPETMAVGESAPVATEAVVVVQESEDRASGVRGAVEVQKSNDVVIGS